MHVQEIEYHSSQKGLSEIEQLPLLHVAGMCVYVCVCVCAVGRLDGNNTTKREWKSLFVSSGIT